MFVGVIAPWIEVIISYFPYFILSIFILQKKKNYCLRCWILFCISCSAAVTRFRFNSILSEKLAGRRGWGFVVANLKLPRPRLSMPLHGGWGVTGYTNLKTKLKSCFALRWGGAKVTELTNFSLYKASTFFVLFVCTVCDNFPEGRFFYAYGYINLFLFSCQLHLNGGGEKDRRPPPLCTPMSLSKVPLREK